MAAQDNTGMTNPETHIVEAGGIGYGYSVVAVERFTSLGPEGSWRVVSGPYTSREQAQIEADRRNWINAGQTFYCECGAHPITDAECRCGS